MEERNVITQEHAIQQLKGYAQARSNQHNAQLGACDTLIACLKALPASEQRDFVIKDFERRRGELVGPGAGRDAQVTMALAELMEEFADGEPELEVGRGITGGQMKAESNTPGVADDGTEQGAGSQAGGEETAAEGGTIRLSADGEEAADPQGEDPQADSTEPEEEPAASDDEQPEGNVPAEPAADEADDEIVFDIDEIVEDELE